MSISAQIAAALSQQFAADRAQNISEPCTYTPVNDAPAAIRVIARRGRSEIVQVMGLENEDLDANIMIQKTDIAAPRKGDQLTLADGNWTVEDILHDLPHASIIKAGRARRTIRRTS